MFKVITESKHDIDWTKSTNGTMLTSISDTVTMMPEVAPIIRDLVYHIVDEEELHCVDEVLAGYVVDVKVHKLMPNEWPCIPNWHMDFVPRDLDYRKRPDLITGESMYLWISGEPVTEFKDRSGTHLAPTQTWISFDQNDLHRGTMSMEHQWRGFIRVIPKHFIHEGLTINIGQHRRHSQVYLDAAKFSW